MEVTLATAQPRDRGIDAVAAATRRLVDAITRAGAAVDGDADRIVADLDALTARIDAHAPDLAERIATMWRQPGPGRFDPTGGTENPLSPPVSLWVEPDGSVRGEVTLGLAFQGPPGHVHGGTSAMLMDHALGIANARAGYASVTVGLDVSFHAAIPVGSTITILARHDGRDGRKVRSSGELRIGDLTCVTASGTFVLMDDPSTRDKFRRPSGGQA
ncbi:PaaI family thioesterase [Dactylosporangium sp. NPDC050588]|uniref:PaaI family thioesterase n=1 Tax=Dactylosporangium sp. NPDC050588 TaxID=3157211 RepID=UPI0033E26341